MVRLSASVGLLCFATSSCTSALHQIDDEELCTENETDAKLLKALPVQCVWEGPPDSGVKASFFFPLDKVPAIQQCQNCKKTLFDSPMKQKHLETAFSSQFVPILFGQSSAGQDICGCKVGKDVKVVLEVGQNWCMNQEDKIQGFCWEVYKALTGFGQVNRWNKATKCDVTCAECENKYEMTKNILSEHIKRMQDETDDDAKDRYKYAVVQKLFIEETIWTQKSEYTPCTKPCADKDGPGHQHREYVCGKKNDPRFKYDDSLCEALLGKAPEPVKETCNPQPCTEYRLIAAQPDEWTECSKVCRDDEGAGTQSRIYKCYEYEGDTQKALMEDTSKCDDALEKLNVKERTRECNTHACATWRANVGCGGKDGSSVTEDECLRLLGMDTKPTLKQFVEWDLNGDGMLSEDELKKRST